MTGIDTLDAVVIGAGWAGLGVSHFLRLRGLRHKVLDRGRIGETWRSQRWDSFRMNTPAVQTIMPGDRYNGPFPEGVLTREEFVALLEDYAKRNALPVEEQVAVTDLSQDPDGKFRIETSSATLQASNVVLASGNLNYPARPGWSSVLPANFHQIDASDYRSAEPLPPGAVLVVGSGQSGCQIAEDLLASGRCVFLATSKTGRLPRRYRGRDIMIWLVQSGFLDVRREQIIQLAGRIPARGVLGAEYTLSLQSLSAHGVVLLGHLSGIDDTGRLTFSNDLNEHIRFADEASFNVKRQIDDYITREAIDAPPASPDAAEIVAPQLTDPPILSLSLASAGISSVIWCTGFRGDFSWVHIPGVLDASGQPVHVDGVAPVSGVYFAGLDFGSTRKSGIILSIAEEAPHLADHIAARAPFAVA